MLWHNVSITPDRLFVILALAALLLGRGRHFLLDWTPFLALLLGYEALRGWADSAGFPVHKTDIIDLERSAFGGLAGDLPTLSLQRAFYRADAVAWYDVAGTLLYFLQFAFPLLLGFALWVGSRAHFHRYVASLLLLSYAGFVTYVFLPVMPPWLASQEGLLPPVAKVIDATLATFGASHDLSLIYRSLSPNQVAAFPSLHAAYPLLGALTAVDRWGRRGAWLLVYPVLVWLTVVYLGEHYVIDVIAGVAYATGAFFITRRWGNVGPVASGSSAAWRWVRAGRWRRPWIGLHMPEQPAPTRRADAHEEARVVAGDSIHAAPDEVPRFVFAIDGPDLDTQAGSVEGAHDGQAGEIFLQGDAAVGEPADA
jgi:hypothetical protein